MKLLFFSTAALMTVAFASKAAALVSGSALCEEPMRACEPQSYD